MRRAITGCSQLVTLRGPARARVGPEMRELGIVRGGAIVYSGGRIEAVGLESEIRPLLDKVDEVIDAGGRVVMPGFVDAHTHPVFAGHRLDEFEQRAAGASYSDIAASGGGIRSTVRMTRAATEQALASAAYRHVEWFLDGGTTTIEAKSGYGLTPGDELKLLRVIRWLHLTGPLACVPTFLGAHEVPDEFQGRREDYVELIIREMLPAVAREHLAEYCDVFVEPTVFPVDDARRILLAARSLGLRARVHADQLSNSGGALLAAEAGAATADHLEHVDATGIAALRTAGVQPVLLPASVYFLGSTRYPPARDMIDAGLALVLATDFNPGSSPTTSMPMVLSLASTHMRMTPAEAITAATVNAAYSLNRGSEIGTLEPGKRAGIVIHDCEDYREIAYFFARPHAQRVIVAGETV